MAVDLRGKGVLVNGGGSGIGQSIAVSLAAEGCKVAVAGRREERLRETAAHFGMVNRRFSIAPWMWRTARASRNFSPGLNPVWAPSTSWSTPPDRI